MSCCLAVFNLTPDLIWRTAVAATHTRCLLQGCPFHRIQSGFCCQGGDIVKHDGSGGDSIYGRKFADEKAALSLSHDAAGILSMANSGKNSNSSQFFFTLAPAPQCDGVGISWCTYQHLHMHPRNTAVELSPVMFMVIIFFAAHAIELDFCQLLILLSHLKLVTKLFLSYQHYSKSLSSWCSV